MAAGIRDVVEFNILTYMFPTNRKLMEIYGYQIDYAQGESDTIVAVYMAAITRFWAVRNGPGTCANTDQFGLLSV